MSVRALSKMLNGVFAVILLLWSNSVLSTTIPEPLERYPLADLVVIGTVMHSSMYRQPVALIVDPDGYGHSAVVGNYVGKRKGVLFQIKTKEIVINELDSSLNEHLIRIPVKTIAEAHEMRLKKRTEKGECLCSPSLPSETGGFPSQ